MMLSLVLLAIATLQMFDRYRLMRLFQKLILLTSR
jgi:hypothetical protein